MTSMRLFTVLLAGIFASGLTMAADSKPAAKISLEDRLAVIEKDAKAFETAVKAGKRVASFCANCHGEGGNSEKPEIPNLAGQNHAYLLVQVNKFLDGRRRNDFMQGMMKAMSDEEKVNVVAYFSSQKVKPHPEANPVLAKRGSEYFYKVCQRCHGENGRGNEKIPRIAGQKPEYLMLSLKRYRDGTGERIDPLMAANTKNLTDADIDSLVAFISGMK